MRVSSLLMRMLEVTIPKCKVGHTFPGVKTLFPCNLCLLGEATKNALKIVRKVGWCFWKILPSCPSKKQSL